MSPRLGLLDACALPFVMLALWLSSDAAAQVHSAASLTAEQIRTLDRARTVVFSPGGFSSSTGRIFRRTRMAM